MYLQHYMNPWSQMIPERHGSVQYLLPHFLHLASSVASLVAFFYPQAEHRLPASSRPRHPLHSALLTLRLPQLGFCTDGLHVVHVICLHHLGKPKGKRKKNNMKSNIGLSLLQVIRSALIKFLQRLDRKLLRHSASK